ncbi:ABC transporter permease [Leptolyngbya sp. PL-A3]|uniref:ABC transporter permease n=1 Tax=Leptolyngbya sp. PL-A3 TaxID=2933911 RepID=UPI00329866EE
MVVRSTVRVKRIVAQVIKELSQLGRDRLTLVLALGLPLALLLLFGFSTSLDVNALNIAIQDLDNTRFSREYIATFERTQKFQIVAQGPVVNLPALLNRGSIAAGLVIPPDFSRDLQLRGREADVQILIDGTDANTANTSRGYVQATTNAFVQSLNPNQSAPAVEVQTRLWFNPGLNTLQYIGPGAIAITVTLFPALLAGLAMAREQEQGTILQVYASSLTGMEYLLGKALAFWLVGMAEVLLVNVEAWVTMGLWFAGDPTPVILGSMLYIACGVFWGIFLGAGISKQSAVIQAVSFTVFLLSLQFSGYIYPVSNIPVALRWLSNVVPARHYIILTRDAFTRGVGWLSVWGAVMALLLLTSLTFLLAWRRVRNMQVGS